MLLRDLYVKIEKIYHDFSLAHVQEGGGVNVIRISIHRRKSSAN